MSDRCSLLRSEKDCQFDSFCLEAKDRSHVEKCGCMSSSLDKNDLYYEEKEIDRIITYCEKDTIAVAQIFLRLRGDELLNQDEIIQI